MDNDLLIEILILSIRKFCKFFEFEEIFRPRNLELDYPGSVQKLRIFEHRLTDFSTSKVSKDDCIQRTYLHLLHTLDDSQA